MMSSQSYTVKPSLSPGQKVQYTEDGVLSMIWGVVRKVCFNYDLDRFEYVVDWKAGQETDESYPRHRLNPI